MHMLTLLNRQADLLGVPSPVWRLEMQFYKVLVGPCLLRTQHNTSFRVRTTAATSSAIKRETHEEKQGHLGCLYAYSTKHNTCMHIILAN